MGFVSPVVSSKATEVTLRGLRSEEGTTQIHCRSVVAHALLLALPIALGAKPALAQQAGQARAHVAHVSSSFPGAPGARGLSITASAEGGVAMLHANLAAGALDDLDAMKRHASHVLHALDPTEGSRGPGLGYGLRRAAGDVASHIGLAANAPDASANVRTHAQHIGVIARTVVERAGEAAGTARRVQEASSASAAAADVEQLRDMVYQIAEGRDLNGDGRLALDDGEAGLQQLEAHVYLLLEGEDLPRVLR